MKKTAPCWVKIKFNRKPFPQTHTAHTASGGNDGRVHEEEPRNISSPLAIFLLRLLLGHKNKPNAALRKK